MTEAEITAAIDAFNDIRAKVGGIKTVEHQRQAMAAALDAVDQLRLRNVAQSAWQPIETAPKDGTEVIVVERHLVRISFWDEPRGGVWSKWPGREPWDPTHWMPLPTIPALSSAQCRETGK
jgi:hypothetical protein